ncbi:unnamed protein product, partial [Iphiclides podalirius]
MKSMWGGNPDFQNEADDEDWDDYSQNPNFGNFRNERYGNAYGNYRGGYGPMNTAGPMNGGGFGPMNSGGFRPMNSGGFGPPRFMGPPPGNFGPGPRPLFAPEEPFMMGRGFGLRGPNKFKRTNDKAFRYLVRCGVPKEHLKNLPASLLQLIEEEYCGLCAQSFTSFAVARTHYVSKNHLKNQKKWLSQHSDARYQQIIEIPFKSRELYCELCDIHITSKSHADSHYAGKPHRAIVEGRKMPRNPTLLQRSNSSRLEQLIRREKKHMKPYEPKEEKDKPTKDSKVFQSELYCDICKTCVTCTDQMTMHLNGKRHLSKEKHHILKMMKGENKDGDEKVTSERVDDEELDENETGKDGENEGEEEGDEGNADGQGEEEDAGAYDWGNGSGTWDEPETI